MSSREKVQKDASQISIHSKSKQSSTENVVKEKGRHSRGPISDWCHRNQLNKEIGLDTSNSKIMEDFERKLSSATEITFRIKKKPQSDHPLLGKPGYLVIVKNKTIGVLTTPVDGRACCNTYVRDENDPLDYCLVNLDGEELMSVTGLGGMDSNNVVTISTGAFRNKAGKVIYGYPGAAGDENISKATTLAGRDDTFVVPTSVLDENEDLKYIFRTEPDNTVYTEILSVDGRANTIAETFVKYKEKKHASKSARISFILNFIGVLPVSEKLLVVGVGIVLFNQCLTRAKRKKPCSPCTIT